MLKEIIKKLTTTRDIDQITSEVSQPGKKGGGTEDPGCNVKHHYGIEAVQQGEGGKKAKGR